MPLWGPEVEFYPRLTFWYGLTPDDLKGMGNLISYYLDQLPDLIDEYQLVMAGAAAFPHMDERGQQAFMDKGRQAARPAGRGSTDVNLAEMAMLGVEVVRVKN